MRTGSGTILAVMAGMIAGCGGTETPPAEPTKPLAQDARKPDAATLSPGTPQPAAPEKPAAWEMDPAKHAIPSTPVKGKLAGSDFTPEAQFQGEHLHLRVLDKDGVPEREVIIKLSEKLRSPGDGFKLVVRPEQPPGADVPEIMTVSPAAKSSEPGVNGYVNGYAMTLDLGKRVKGKVPGKIFLSLPSDDKDFLAGTFTADYVRSPTVPPGPDDAPFIQGTLKVTGAANPMVRVGYAAQVAPAMLAFDSIQMSLMGPGWARSDNTKSGMMESRVSTLVAAERDKPARFEHIHLAPGRYLVYATIDGGPAVWKWLDLASEGQVTADLTLDAGKSGSLEVKVPAGAGDEVMLAPADEPGKPVPSTLRLGIALSLGLQQKVTDGTAKFQKLGPGRYEVHAGSLSDIVEIKPGETAKVTLAAKPAPKKE